MAGRYRIGALLGSGGIGQVWLGFDDVLQPAVALKERAAEPGHDGVLREARAASVVHPGVVRVHDVVLEDQGTDWIVMEVLVGQSLSAAVRNRGPFAVDAVRRIGEQILLALIAIHRAGLVHRDVKPGNVQLCDDGRIVLTDFGLARPSEGFRGMVDGTVEGSPPFMAPEAIRHGRFGPASDLYALGATLYTASEGHSPFEADSLCALAGLEPRPPLEFPERAGELSEVILSLMDPDPHYRMDAETALLHLRRPR